VSDARSWTLQASGPGVSSTALELGRDDPPGTLQRRMSDVVASYPMMAAHVGGPPARIDARYANGIAAAAPSRAPETAGPTSSTMRTETKDLIVASISVRPRWSSAVAEALPRWPLPGDRLGQAASQGLRKGCRRQHRGHASSRSAGRSRKR